MSGITDSNATDNNDNTITVISSGNGSGVKADVGTKPGGEKGLHVIAELSTTVAGSVPSIGPSIRYRDMKVANGGVARDTIITNAAYVTLFSKSGNGLFFGFACSLEEVQKYELRLVIDGNVIFDGINSGSINTSDLEATGIYGYNDDEARVYVPVLGFHTRKKTIYFSCPSDFPIKYSSSIVISIKRQAGEGSKKFKGGFVVLTED